MAKSLSDLLIAADKRNGLPLGTMQAIMQQETGGNQKYLDDPTAYHYDLNADGKRIAKHTGKVSTAFGPFGILESTAADPGYGIAPLKDKASLEDQIRFASEYVAKRGLAGYGEGAKYAKQVAARIPSTEVVPDSAPVVVATAAPIQEEEAVPVRETAQAPVTPEEWRQFQHYEAAAREPVYAADLAFELPKTTFQAPQIAATPKVDFSIFRPQRGRA